MLRYPVENKTIRPNPENLKPVLKVTLPNNIKSLRQMLGLLTCLKGSPTTPLKMIELKRVTSFPLSSEAVKDFESVKQDIANVYFKKLTKILTLLLCNTSAWLSLPL